VFCLLIVALQSVYLYGVAVRVPTLELSLFVWRLAFPAAFLAFGALLAGWREVDWPARRGLLPLVTLSAACMMPVLADIAPLHMAILSIGMDDRRALIDYDRGEAIWGIREFWPNYAGLPRACENSQAARKVTFPELRAGVKAETSFVVVHRAPVGLVNYRANGSMLPRAACDADLLLGPLPSGATAMVTEGRVATLLWMRVLGFVLVLAIVWWLVQFGRPCRR